MQGAFQAAVDAYLSVQPSDSVNMRKLADAWHAAARLAAHHLPARAGAVASQAARNLLAMSPPDARGAAALFLQAGDRAAAVRAFASAGLVQEARDASNGDTQLEALVSQLEAAAPVAGGGSVGGVREIDEHARRGNWDQVR